MTSMVRTLEIEDCPIFNKRDVHWKRFERFSVSETDSLGCLPYLKTGAEEALNKGGGSHVAMNIIDNFISVGGQVALYVIISDRRQLWWRWSIIFSSNRIPIAVKFVTGFIQQEIFCCEACNWLTVSLNGETIGYGVCIRIMCKQLLIMTFLNRWQLCMYAVWFWSEYSTDSTTPLDKMYNLVH